MSESSVNENPDTPKQQPVVKPPSRIHLRWIEDQRFDSGRVDGPRSIIDGASKAAPGPVETLVGALAACSATDVLMILNKRRTPPSEFEVNVVAERAQSVPARLTAVHMTFRIRGEGVERSTAERAIDLSVNKYCSVRDSLDPNIPVNWTLDLGDEPSA